MAHYRTVFSHGRVSQISELTSAAALCLTPREWVNRWNNWNRQQLRYFATEINTLNAALGQPAFRVDIPEGGWYVPVRINRALFGEHLQTSVDAGTVLLYYGQRDPQSGLAMLPGELFGRGSQDGWYTLRGNLATDTGTIVRTVQRLRDVAMALHSDRRSQILEYALQRARRVVPDLDQTVANAGTEPDRLGVAPPGLSGPPATVHPTI